LRRYRRGGRERLVGRPIPLRGPIALRATRLRDAVLLQHRAEGDGGWAMARLAPMPGGGARAGVGPYLCSPERAGFEARFSDFALTEPMVRDLHA
jgi:regulation of enolase protein 1 (concanavalin A-like superfamily)